MKSSRPKNRAILVKTSKGRDKKFLSMATSLENGQEISGYTIDTPIAGRKAWMFWGRYPEDASIKQDLMLTRQDKNRRSMDMDV